VAFGGAVLQSAQVDLAFPLLGEVHLVTSTLFDIGVYLVVVGLVLDLLRALGSQIDRQILREERDAEGART
jgi:multicomponent Na+:H+ antiporter subunit A